MARCFDVMLTMDDGVAYQQDLRSLPVAVMILNAHSNDIDDLRELIPAILERSKTLAARSVSRIP